MAWRVPDWCGTDSEGFLQSPEARGVAAAGRLAPVLGDQLVGSAVGVQGFLGVGVLRQLGLAARKRTVLLQIFLGLGIRFG